MFKKSLFIVLSLSILLFFSGCIPHLQLNERDIVQAIGIDFENGEYILTFQVYSPSTDGGNNVSATPDNAKIVTVSGPTVSEAMHSAATVQSKHLFIGHNRVIVLGRSVAEKSISTPLYYFINNSAARLNTKILLSDSKASDIVACNITQGLVPAEVIAKMAENSQDNGYIEDVELYELFMTLENEHSASVIPIIKAEKQNKIDSESSNSSSESEEIESISKLCIIGMALVVDDKVIENLEIELCTGMLFIKDNIYSASLSVETKSGISGAVQILSSQTTVTPAISNKTIKFNLKIKCNGTLSETSYNDSNQGEKAEKINKSMSIEGKEIEEMEKAVSDYIVDLCKSTFSKAAEYGCDIFNFGNIIRQKNSAEWSYLSKNWDKEIKTTSIEVDVDFKITKTLLEYKQ